MTPVLSNARWQYVGCFPGSRNKSKCYFLEKNLYCFNSCTSTFLDLRKNYLHPWMTYRDWKAELWLSQVQIPCRFYTTAPKPQNFSILTSSLSQAGLGKSAAGFNIQGWLRFWSSLCVYGNAQWAPASSGHLLIQAELRFTAMQGLI